ncbi:hypothetical protein HDU89_004136 [Geranomyces variabilis]|nr:hypothetical protein HDU89_004136 [Geranomyces variabilis]
MTSITTPRRSQSGDGHDSLPPLGDPQQQQQQQQQLREDAHGGGRTLVSSTGSVHAWPERPHTARNPNGPPAANDDEAEDFAVERKKVHISDDAESHGRQHRAWTAQSVRGRERTYDVNLVTTHMPLYEPLLDEYLADYFNSPKIRQHLQKLGLVDAEGNIIDAKRFKYNQIRLDQAQYQANIMKRMEELDFDRDIEVAIRRQNELEKAPRSHKLRKAVESAPSTLPYPEFLANYPATMTRTALLYAEKPASLTKAEEMLVAKLRQQAPRKLKALGLTPELLSGKEQHARNEARRDRKLLWKAGSSSRQASAGSARAPHGAGKRPTTAAPGSRRNDQRELVVHDDLSGDEWEGLEGHEVTTGAGASRGPKQLHEQDSVTNLFEIAKRQYQSGNIDDAETQVRRILQRVGRPGTAAATAGNETNGTSKASAAGSTPPRTAPASAATTRPTSAAVAKLRSGRSTPRHRSLRPKSARPTRESHFPIASDFSDFDAGSEGGYESDGEVNMSEDQAIDNQGIVNVVVGSEPIAESEEVIKAVIEQTQVETPSAQDGNQEEKQLGGTGENKHAENQESEVPRIEQAHDAEPAQPPSHDGYDADFEGTDTSQAPAEKSAPTDDDCEAEFDQDQLPPMTASVSNPAVSQHKSHSIAKFWDVESVDAVVEQSGPAYPRTTENSSFDVMAGGAHRSKPGSKHGSGIVAAVSHAVHKITHRGSKEAIDANHDHENSEEPAPTERHRSSPLLQHDQSDEQQHQSQPHKPQHTLSSPLLRDGSHTAVVAGGPSAQRLNSPAGSIKNSPAGSIKNVARVAVSSPLAKSSIAKSSPSLGYARAGKSNSATAAAAAAGTVPLPPSVAQSTANISGTRPGTAAQSTANVNRAGASRQVLKSTPNLAAERGVAGHTVTTVSGIDPDSNNAKSTTSVALQKNAAQSASALGRRSDSFEKAAGEQLPPSVAASVANVTDGKTSPRSTANLKSAAPSTNNIALQKNAAKSASALGRRSDSFEKATRQPLPPSVAASVANVADGKANARSAANLKSAAQSTKNIAYEEPEQESRPPPVRPAQSAPDVLAENGIDYAAAQPLPPSAFQSIANVTENAKNARSTSNLKNAAGQSSPALQRGASAKSVDAAAAVPLPASTAQSVANVANDPARSRDNLQSHAARSAADLQDGEAAAKAQLKKSAQSTPNVTAAHADDNGYIDRAAAEPLPPSVAASTANVTRGGVSGSVRFASQSELLDRHGARSSSPTIKKGKDIAQSSPNVLADGGKGSSDIDRAAAMALPPSAMPSTVNMANSSPKMSRSIKTPVQSSPNLRGSALDRAATQALPPSAAPSVANVAAAGAARSSADVRGSQNALSAKGNTGAAAQSSPNVQRSTTALDRAAAQALPESVAPSLAYGLDQNARSSPDVLSDHTAKQSSPALNKSRAALQSKGNVAELGAPTVDRAANIPLPASVAPSLATGLDQISLEARKSTPALAKTGGGKSTPALHASSQEAAIPAVDRAANVPLPASVAPSLATGLNRDGKSTPSLEKSAAKSTPALHNTAGATVDRAAKIPLPASVAPSLATGFDGAREAPNHQSHAAGTSTTTVGLGARAPSSGSISKLVGRTAGNKIPDAGSLAEMRKMGSVEFAGVAPEDVAGAGSVVRAEEQHVVGQHDAHDSTASATVPAAKSGSNADIWADIRQPVDNDKNTRTEQAATAPSLAHTNSGLKSHGSNNKLVDPPQLPGKPTAEAHKTGGGSKPASRSGSKSNLVKEVATGGGGKKTGSRPVSRSQSQRSLNAHGVSPAPVKA